MPSYATRPAASPLILQCGMLFKRAKCDDRRGSSRSVELRDRRPGRTWLCRGRGSSDGLQDSSRFRAGATLSLADAFALRESGGELLCGGPNARSSKTETSAVARADCAFHSRNGLHLGGAARDCAVRQLRDRQYRFHKHVRLSRGDHDGRAGNIRQW